MKTIILFCTLFLTACSSVPLTTMMYFSGTKPEDFFTVDPKGITVMVSINSAANFEPIRAISLSATIEDAAGDRKIDFPLELIKKTTQPAVSGIFSDSPALDIFLLKLTPEAIENIKIFHKESVLGINKGASLSAGVNFSNAADYTEELVLSVALKLTIDGKFITLIDQWEVAA